MKASRGVTARTSDVVSNCHSLEQTPATSSGLELHPQEHSPEQTQATNTDLDSHSQEHSPERTQATNTELESRSQEQPILVLDSDTDSDGKSIDV